MGIIGSTIAEFDFFPDSSPAIVGELASGQIVNIALWEDGALTTISSSGCSEIGNTGRYSWSTSGIPILTSSRQQFHWQMTDGVNTDQGDFILVSHENRDGGMPSLNDQDLYMVTQS